MSVTPGMLGTSLWTFDILDKVEWLNRYKSTIRTIVDWEAVAADDDMGTNIWQVKPGDTVRTVWYEDGGWMRGKSIEMGPDAEGWSILRAPGVEYRGKLTLLDGTHRLKYGKVRLLFVDVLCAETETQARYFADLFSRGMLT